MRERIGVRLWRAIHWTAYASWPLAVVHGEDAAHVLRSSISHAACVHPGQSNADANTRLDPTSM
jgi:hypothetical protein